MADKVTKEICTTNDSTAYVPVASTSEAGVASFNSEDFAVSSDGKVSSLQKVGAIQYLGESVTWVQDGSNNLMIVTLSEYSAKPIADAQVGDLVMLMEDTEDEAHGGLLAGYVFAITSIYNLAKGQVLCRATPLFNLRGPDSSSLYTVTVDEKEVSYEVTETVRTEQLFNIDDYTYSTYFIQGSGRLSIFKYIRGAVVDISELGTGYYYLCFMDNPNATYDLQSILDEIGGLDGSQSNNRIQMTFGCFKSYPPTSTGDGTGFPASFNEYSYYTGVSGTAPYYNIAASIPGGTSSAFCVDRTRTVAYNTYTGVYIDVDIDGAAYINISFWDYYLGNNSGAYDMDAVDLVPALLERIVLIRTEADYSSSIPISEYIPYYETVTSTVTETVQEVVDYTLDPTFSDVINEAVEDAVSEITTASFDNYYTKTEVDNKLDNLVQSDDILDIVNSSNPWYGKTIWWCGTSIPAGNDTALSSYGNGTSYPVYCASLLGATCVNVSVGSSMARANMSTGDYVNAYANNALRCLSATKAEKQDLIDNYSTYSAVFNDPDTHDSSYFTTSMINTILGYSFEELLLPYLDGTKDMPDLFVFDHGHNDYGSVFGYDIDLEPTTTNINSGALAEDTYMTDNDYEMLKYYFFDSSDDEFAYMEARGSSVLKSFVASLNRNCYLGAMNFLITLIYKYNPRATIVQISNYDNLSRAKVITAQEYLCESWDIPYCRVYEKTGWTTQHYIPGTHDYWDEVTDGSYPDSSGTGGGTKDITPRDIFFYDGTHPHTDKLSEAIPLYAKIIAEYLKTVPKRSDT